MTDEGSPTRQQIDELLQFLPVFGTAGRDFVAEKDQKSMYPSYTDEVEKFYRLAGWFGLRSYDPKKHGAMTYDDEAIRSASLDDVRHMLTFCVRGERFSDGHWGTMIRDGRIGAILRRLSELRDAVP